MMNFQTVLLGSIVALVTIAGAQTIDFSNIENRPLSWKDVFDGGFHPAWRGNGESVCHQSEVSPILQNGDKQFKLTQGAIQFSIIGNYKMSSVSYYGREGLTADEANLRVDQIIAAFSNANKVTKGQIKKIGGRYNYMDSESNTVLFFDNHNIIYSFGASGNKNREVAERLTIKLRLKHTRGVARRVGGKIQPPEGYEHLSLDPLVVNKEYYDDLARRAEEFNRPEAKAAREKKQQEIDRIREEMNRNLGQLPQDRETTLPAKPVEDERKTNAFPWWIIGLVLLLAIALFILKEKSKR